MADATTATGDDPIAEGIAEFMIAAGNAGIRASENAKKAQQSVGALEGIYREVAKGAATIEFAKGTAELETQQATVKAANAAGVDPKSGADVIFQLMDRLGKSNKKLLERTADVVDKKSTVLWDDPLKFLKDNFNLPDSERRLTAAIDEAKTISGTIATVNQAVSHAQDTYRKVSEPLNQSVIEARTGIAAAEALARAEQMKIEGLKYNTESITAIAQASKQTIDAMIALKGVRDADTRLRLALESHGLQREQFNWQKSKEDIARAAKAAEKTIDVQTLEYINRSKAALGQPLMTPEQFTFQKQLKQSPELAYHLENGIRMQTLGITVVGTTPAESLAVIKEIPNKLPDIQNETLGLIKRAEELVKSKPHDVKDVKGIADKINKMTQDMVDEQYITIRPGSIFDIGDLKNFLGTSKQPGVAPLFNLPISQKLLIPAIDAGVALNDPKVILGLTEQAVIKGTITSSEALGLSDIYKRASSLNIAARGFTKFGIVIPNNGAQYNVKVGGLFNSNTIDLNDSVSLSTYIARALRPEAPEGSAGSPFYGAP